MKRRSIHVVLLLLLASVATVLRAAQTSSAGVAVTISGTTITASGVTPGGRAVLFGTMRERRGSRAHVMRHGSTAMDEDGDGIVTFELGREVPWKSVWSVVDFGSGRYGVATPEGFPLAELARDVEPIPANNGQLTHLVLQTTPLELLHVRPGTGAWMQTLGDGNVFDDDGASDGKATAKASRSVPMNAFSDTPAPDKFQSHDVVVLIHLATLEVFAGQVGAAQ